MVVLKALWSMPDCGLVARGYPSGMMRRHCPTGRGEKTSLFLTKSSSMDIRKREGSHTFAHLILPTSQVSGNGVRSVGELIELREVGRAPPPTLSPRPRSRRRVCPTGTLRSPDGMISDGIGGGRGSACSREYHDSPLPSSSSGLSLLVCREARRVSSSLRK